MSRLHVAVYLSETYIEASSLSRMEKRFPQCTFDICPTLEALRSSLNDAEVAFISALPEDLGVPPKQLRWVQVTSSGMDHHQRLLEWLPYSVPITNARGAHATSIANYVLMWVLALQWDLVRLIEQYRTKTWQRWKVKPLKGVRAGILGYGALGQAIAGRLSELGMQLEAIRRTPAKKSTIPEFTVSHLHERLPTWDFLILAVPLAPDTRSIIGERELRLMKETAYLINVGRGGLIDEHALVMSLIEGSLGGAVLDVTEVEPLPPSSPLWNAPRCSVTPHISGYSTDLGEIVVGIFQRNLKAYLQDKPLVNIVRR